MNNTGDIEPGTYPHVDYLNYRPRTLVRRVRSSRHSDIVVVELAMLCPEYTLAAIPGDAGIFLPLYWPNGDDHATLLSGWMHLSTANQLRLPLTSPSTFLRRWEFLSEKVAEMLLRNFVGYTWLVDDDDGFSPEWKQEWQDLALTRFEWARDSMVWLDACLKEPWRMLPSLQNIKDYAGRWDSVKVVPPVDKAMRTMRRRGIKRP